MEGGLGLTPQGHKGFSIHSFSAFVGTRIGPRIVPAFSESRPPCCCLPCEHVRGCFCGSQLDINHFTPTLRILTLLKTLERRENPPLTVAAAFCFPSSASFIRLAAKVMDAQQLVACAGTGQTPRLARWPEP